MSENQQPPDPSSDFLAAHPRVREAIESQELAYKSKDMFSWNCREELDGHVSCVKLFLEDHVKYGTKYTPGSRDINDHCDSTRDLYIKCMAYRKKHPVSVADVVPSHFAPKPCAMELNMHGSCVERQLERTQKLGHKYFTQGGDDRCARTRTVYENCMYNYDKLGTDINTTDFKTVVHQNVKAFDFRPYGSAG